MSDFLGLIAILALIALYFLPTILIIRNKNKVSKVPTILINIFFGWTFIGWFISLLMSTSKDANSNVIINNSNNS